MSNPWGVLGLERGADRVEIRRAYARRLKQTNPEDDPQGFMELRQAYEWLLDHIEYQSADFDDYRSDEPVAPATAAADEPVAELAVASPWAPAIEQDPDEAAVDGLLEALAWHLSRAGNEGRQHSRELVAGILSHPALAKLSIAGRVEHRLAHIILEYPPYSDAIILQAVDAFRWTDQRRAHEYPFSGVIARLDEWRLIQSLERPDDGLHKAWRLLTEQASVPVRWWNARTGRREQVAELLDYAEYSAPGLVHSMDPDAAAWWRQELGQDRWPIDPILWRLAAGAILYLTLMALGLPAIQAALVASGVAVATMVDMLLARRLLARLEWKHRPQWQYAAPILAMLAVPPILLFVPLTTVTAAIVVAVAVGLVWAARILLSDPTGVPRERRWAVALGLSAVALLIGTTDQPVPLAQFTVLVAMAWLLQLNLPMLRPAAGAVVDRLTRDWAWPVLTLYGIGMLVASWAIEAHGQVPLVRVGIGVFALFAAGGIAPFTARAIPPLVLALMIVAGNLSMLGAQGAMLNGQVSNSASAGEALVSIHKLRADVPLTLPQQQAKNALAEMSRRNPQFHAKITALMATPGGTSAERAANVINSEIEGEMRRLKPLSSNRLIADHERLKADIVTALRKVDVGACAKFGYVLNQESDPMLHSRLREVQLAIVAHGPADATEKSDVPLPTVRDFDAKRALLLKELEAELTPRKADRKQLSECNGRVATALAMTQLSDDQLGTLARSAKESRATPPASAN